MTRERFNDARVIAIFALAAFLILSNAKASAGVAEINAKLRRYVHPTGRCGGDSEQLATMYGNGDGYLGKPVSCGGRLGANENTVASRTLPCGTRLQITNPRNGRSTSAVVRDRGPYTIASLDLGPGVYHALGMTTSIYVCVNRR